MFKNEKGSVTILAFVVMLFLSLYGAMILATSARKYSVQTKNIETITRIYKFQGLDTNEELQQQELIKIYKNIGGKVISTNH